MLEGWPMLNVFPLPVFAGLWSPNDVAGPEDGGVGLWVGSVCNCGGSLTSADFLLASWAVWARK